MLAGLENKGEDIAAIGEYLLGDKNKFAGMIFGREIAEGKECTKFGTIKIITNRSELYYSQTLDFSNIEEDSIYYNRNHILPLFQIQNALGESVDLVEILSKGKSYYANFIGKKFFNGKKFYEIPNDELANFIKLIERQVTPNNQSSAIIDILKYKNEMINNLTEDEIKKFSYEILRRIPSIFGSEIKAGHNLEEVMRIALEEEIRKINQGQPIETTNKKKKIIVKMYSESFKENNESNMYINDYLNDFYFEVSQAEQEEAERQKRVIQVTPQQIEEVTKDVSTEKKIKVENTENAERTRDEEKRSKR